VIYLPFEGAGAISTWQLELTKESQLRQFNYDTISDVILHLRYTSREDVGDFRGAAVTHLTKDVLGANISPQLPLYRLFDLMHEFPTEWYAFLHPAAAQQEKLQIIISAQMFPFIAQGRSIQVQGFSLWVRTISSITSLTAQVDPGTGGASIFAINFGSADPNGFYTARQNGGLAAGETRRNRAADTLPSGFSNSLARPLAMSTSSFTIACAIKESGTT
jgi:Tc toxin complex TcA C-terminal TcB-binding domain